MFIFALLSTGEGEQIVSTGSAGVCVLQFYPNAPLKKNLNSLSNELMADLIIL